MDHEEIAVGACPTCGHEVCEICLQGSSEPDAFECPECGEAGVVIYDAVPGGARPEEGGAEGWGA